MKQTRGRQAASVVRAPNYSLVVVDIDRFPERSRIAQCEEREREGIMHEFEDDPSLLEKPKIQPYDPREDDKIWHQLHDPKPAKRSITQHITRVLPGVDELARTEAVPWYGYDFYEDHTIVDKYATQPIPVNA